MSEIIVIDDIPYPGYTQEEPELKEFKNYILKNRIKIIPTHYKKIQKMWSVLYINKSNNKYNYGTLIKFVEPDIFILKNTIYNIWTLDVNNYDIYLTDIKKVKDENKKKENLWQLYKNGYVKILDEPLELEEHEDAPEHQNQ
jgi:hypothetical protein